MQSRTTRWHKFVNIALGGLLLAGLQGCTFLGPKTLSQGRPAYNDAIASTNAEQTLAWMVKFRYGVVASQLKISSITANVRFRANATVQAGFGADENFQGNIVPLSTGVAYDENPTISYLPVQGDRFLRRMLSPVPLSLFVPIFNTTEDPSMLLALMVRDLNGIENSDFLSTPEAGTDQRFKEFIELIGLLHRANKMRLTESPGTKESFQIWIHDYAPKFQTQVRRLANLLGIEDFAVGGEDPILPVESAFRPSTSKSVAINLRSMFEIGRILSAAIDVPDEDRAKGLTIELGELGLAGSLMKIHSSKSKPRTAAAATRYRGWWFYVAGEDQQSKLVFRLFNSLLVARLNDHEGGASAVPLLTVPVSQ